MDGAWDMDSVYLGVDEIEQFRVHQCLHYLKNVHTRGMSSAYILCQPKVDDTVGVRLRMPQIIEDIEELGGLRQVCHCPR